ncbi:MAG: glycosyltransferase [bacterium]
MKSILVIKQGLGIGGSETLTIRMCNWLVDKGVNVVLLVEKRPEKIAKELNTKIAKITYNGSFLELLNKQRAKHLVKKHQLEGCDCIYGYGPLELVTSLSLGRFIKDSKAMIGVYHKNAYNQINGNKVFKKFTQRLFKKISQKNILFMNGPVRKSHEEILSCDFKNAKIWPLPLLVPKYKEVHHRTNKIVSVGNLKRFKSYNMTMIDVVKDLIDKGYNIEYDIYGEGYMQKKMEEKIGNLGLSKYVNIKGQVAYEKFAEVVREGFAFVGLGTAVLEAASFGVPAITCVSYSEKPISFGFVNELTNYNVGSPINNYTYKNIIDLLELLINADDPTYEKIRKENYQYVNENFELNKVMKQFLIHHKDADVINYTSKFKKLIFLIYLSSIIDRIKILIKKLLK